MPGIAVFIRLAAATVAAALVTLVAFSGTLVTKGGGFGAGGGGTWECWEHGWPMVFLTRCNYNSQSAVFSIADGVETFSTPALLCNIGVWLAAVVGCWYFFCGLRLLPEPAPFQFSCWHLIAAMTVAGIMLGDVARCVYDGDRQEELRVLLKSEWHECDYSVGRPVWATRILGTNHVPWSSVGIERLSLHGSSDDDAARRLADVLPKLPHLRRLYLHQEESSRVSDDGLAVLLENAVALEHICLGGTRRMTGSAFERVSPARHPLKDISAYGSALNDRGFAAIARIPTIECLDISGTSVTSQTVLEHVRKMPRLRQLRCRDTSIGDREAEAIRQLGIECDHRPSDAEVRYRKLLEGGWREGQDGD